MKKLFYRTFFFLLFSIFLYLIFLFSFGLMLPASLTKNIFYKKGTHGYLHSRVNEVKNYPNVDILFVGSSHAYRGFDTRIFKKYGLNTFNLGSSSQTPLQTKVLLKRNLSVLNPKILVFEVYPSTFDSDGVESALDLITNDTIIDNAAFQMVLSINNLKVYNSFLIGLMEQLLGLKNKFIEKNRMGKDLYISGGYVQSDIAFNNKKERGKAPIIFLENQKKAFEEIVALAKQKKIQLILVQAPVTYSAYQTVVNKKEIDDYFKSKSANYYNFSYMPTLSDSLDFYDTNHLNQNGVEKFNKAFIDTLQKDGLIPIKP